MRRLLCVSIGVLVSLAVSPARAATYDAQLRFAPSNAADVAGYKLYRSHDGEPYGPAQDLGLPAVDPDGRMTVLVDDLDVRTTYVFVATAYAGGGLEGGLSNELRIGYADVAPVVDSDGDGLTDGEEDVNLNQAVDPGETDPENPDTDGDGVLDGDDQCEGSGLGTPVLADGCPPCVDLTAKLQIRSRGKKWQLDGRAKAQSGATFDPMPPRLLVDLRDAAGRSLYRAEAGGTAFRRNRWAAKLPKGKGRVPPETNGLKELHLERTKHATRIVVKAATSDLAEVAVAPSITWTVFGGQLCLRSQRLTCQSKLRLTICR